MNVKLSKRGLDILRALGLIDDDDEVNVQSFAEKRKGLTRAPRILIPTGGAWFADDDGLSEHQVLMNRVNPYGVSV